MATVQDPPVLSVPAGSDLSAKQFYFMDITSGKLAVAGAGTRVAGILTNKPNASGVAGSLRIAGIAKVVAGGSISAGGGVASDASGKAVAATGSAFVCGIAMEDMASGGTYQVLLTGCAAVGLAAASEAVSTSTALNPAIPTSLLAIVGALAITLADGSYVGQTKTIEVVSASGGPAATVTLATASSSESTVHVFTAAGQRLSLEWRADGWKVIGKRRAGRQAVVVGTTVLTGYDMASAYDLAVTATVHSLTSKGIPAGTIAGERIYIDVLTAASTPVGDIAITAKTTVGVAATSLAHLNGTDAALSAEWDGAAWQALIFTTGSSAAATLS